MSRPAPSRLDTLAAKPRRLVLVDAIGALVTAVVVGLVLPPLHRDIGISRGALQALGALATMFTIMSWGAFFLVPHPRSYLRAIGIANLGYVAVTGVVLVAAHDTVTGIGLAYFLVEGALVVALAALELAVAARRGVERRTAHGS